MNEAGMISIAQLAWLVFLIAVFFNWNELYEFLGEIFSSRRKTLMFLMVLSGIWLVIYSLHSWAVKG